MTQQKPEGRDQVIEKSLHTKYWQAYATLTWLKTRSHLAKVKSSLSEIKVRIQINFEHHHSTSSLQNRRHRTWTRAMLHLKERSNSKSQKSSSRESGDRGWRSGFRNLERRGTRRNLRGSVGRHWGRDQGGEGTLSRYRCTSVLCLDERHDEKNKSMAKGEHGVLVWGTVWSWFETLQ